MTDSSAHFSTDPTMIGQSVWPLRVVVSNKYIPLTLDLKLILSYFVNTFSHEIYHEVTYFFWQCKDFLPF